MEKFTEKLTGVAESVSAVICGVQIQENLNSPVFDYQFGCVGPVEEKRSRYVELRDLIAERSLRGEDTTDLQDEFMSIPMESKWSDKFKNTVTTGGANDILNKYFTGSSYTAAWYLGLISSTSYSAIAAGDTMASHAGWLESGNANTPTYSQSSRPTLAFSAASARTMVTSSAIAFSITGTGTIEGAFTTTVATKDGTTGILYSAGLFTGGTRAVLNGDTVNVSLSLSV